MYDGALSAQVADGVERLPVAVVVLPEQRGEVEMQLDVQLVNQARDLRVAHDAEEKAPLHRWAVGESGRRRKIQRENERMR